MTNERAKTIASLYAAVTTARKAYRDHMAEHQCAVQGLDCVEADELFISYRNALFAWQTACKQPSNDNENG